MNTVLEKIYDPDNKENIILYNRNNEPIEFQQIAVIEYDDELYLILQPVILPEGASPDEALVFIIEEDFDSGDCSFNLITDSKIIDAVFTEYYILLNKYSK